MTCGLEYILCLLFLPGRLNFCCNPQQIILAKMNQPLWVTSDIWKQLPACFLLESQIQNSSQQHKMTNYLRDTTKTWKIDSLNQFPLNLKFQTVLFLFLFFFLFHGTCLGGIHLSLKLCSISSHSVKENIPSNSANILWRLFFDIKITIKIVLYVWWLKYITTLST